MVDIAEDRADADVARWKAKCLDALEANEQLSDRAQGRVSDLARLLGRLARALPAAKANANFSKELSQLAQALTGRPFDERLNRGIRIGYEQALQVITAQEAEQSALLAALNEAVGELELLAGSWLLKRRLKRFRNSLNGKKHPVASQLVAELKDFQKATLGSLREGAQAGECREPRGMDAERLDPVAPDGRGKMNADTGARGPAPRVGHQPGTAPGDREPAADWPAVQQVLLSLLERMQAVSETREQLQQLHQQVVAGVDEHMLIPVLERVRDLFDVSVASLRGEYRLFLDGIDQRLGGLLSGLDQILAQGQTGLENRRQFNLGIENGFAQIRAQANAAEDLDTLKHSIEDNLQHLDQVLSDYRSESDADADRSNAQLKALSQRLAELEGESQVAREQLDQQRALALTDSLTQLPNRRAMDERLEHEYAQWHRYNTPLSIALLDIDHFKKVNDNYGHAGGDRALELMASIISKRIRQVDFAARFGGEEFVILMPSTGLEQAGILLEQLRGFIEDCGFNYQGQPVPITVSFGLTQMRAGDEDPQVALERADAALYNAKQSGRNRVCCA